MADRGRAVADLDVGDRPLAAADAVEPVLQVSAGLPEGRFVAPFLLLGRQVDLRENAGRDLGRIRRDLVAVDLQLSLLSHEHGPSHRSLIEDQPHLDAVAIPHRDRAGRPIREWGEGDRPRGVGAQRPLELVKPVSAPVGDLSAREIAPRHPCHPGRMVGAVGGLVEPGAPVEAGGHGLARGIGNRTRGRLVVVHRTNLEQPAESAGPDELAGQPVDGHRTLLRADLQHAAVLPHGIDEDATLLNVERERFLRIHVFSRLAGVDAGQNPLEIADADDHGVDVRPVEHPPVVGGHVPRAAAGRFVLFRPR